MSEDEIKKKTLSIYNSGFKRISYVASGKNIEQKEFETISKAINEMKETMTTSNCVFPWDF